MADGQLAEKFDLTFGENNYSVCDFG